MQFWSVFGGAGSIWDGTSWYLVVLGQYNLELLGFTWNWVSTRLVCLYILKKINGDANQPTDQPTNRANKGQTAFSKVRQKKKGRDLQYAP